MFVLNVLTVLVFSAVAAALPQDPQLTATAPAVISATNTASNTAVLSSSSTNNIFFPTLPSRTIAFLSATNTLFASTSPSTRTSPVFIGWSLISTRSTTTEFSSTYCARSSIYVESELSGTTYAGCCHTRNGTCATSVLAQSCVENVLMVAERTVSDCGTSTCVSAVIYQNIQDGARKTRPISFHQCVGYGTGGETFYRTLPASNAVTRPLYTGSTSSSRSSSSSRRKGMKPHTIAIIVIGVVFALLFFCVVVPVLSWRVVRLRVIGEGVGKGKFQRSPPSVSVAPACRREMLGETVELVREVTPVPVLGDGGGGSALLRYEGYGMAR